MPGLPIPKIFAPALRADKIHLFDVGAAGGLQGRWRQMLPYLEAFLFEPDERSYEKMVARADGINYLNYALGGKAGSVELHLTRKPQCSSIYIPNRRVLDQFPDASRFDVIGTANVTVTMLDHLRSSSKIPRVDFIKLDVEGYEYEILKGAGDVLGEAIGVEAEVEFQQMRQGQPLFCDVHRTLSEKGYDLFDLRFGYWKRSGPLQTRQSKGQVVYADALYFRRVEDLAKTIRAVSPADARRLSIHASTLFMIYGYYDCAYTLLSARQDLFSAGEWSEVARFFRPRWWFRKLTSGRLHIAVVYLADLLDPARRGYFKVLPMIGNLRDGGGATDSKAQKTAAATGGQLDTVAESAKKTSLLPG